MGYFESIEFCCQAFSDAAKEAALNVFLLIDPDSRKAIDVVESFRDNEESTLFICCHQRHIGTVQRKIFVT